MYIAFLDESGIGSQSHFFTLGAICIEAETLKEIGMGIRAIKTKYKIPPNIEVKWNLTATNELFAKNSLPLLSYDDHKKIKEEIIKLIFNLNEKQVFILWAISPLIFYKEQKWRSYDFALNVLLKKLKEKTEADKTTTMVLIDELSGLAAGISKEEIRSLTEQYIHTFQSDENNACVTLLVPGVNSSISYGHQLNDITTGLISYYLYKIHQNNDSVSSEIKNHINEMGKKIPANFRSNSKIAVFNAGIMIYPQKQIRQDLKRIMKKTYDYLYRDFKFC